MLALVENLELDTVVGGGGYGSDKIVEENVSIACVRTSRHLKRKWSCSTQILAILILHDWSPNVYTTINSIIVVSGCLIVLFNWEEGYSGSGISKKGTVGFYNAMQTISVCSHIFIS